MEALRSYDLLDQPGDHVLDGVVRVVARVLEVPIVLISLVDDERVWMAASVGVDVAELPREGSFCEQVVTQGTPLCIRHAGEDPRFHENPLVVGPPGVQGYLGVPLLTPGGHAIGTLCAVDTVPRVHRDHDVALVEALAQQVMDHFEVRRQRRELVRAREALAVAEQQRAMAESAARIGHWRFDLATETLTWSPVLFELHQRDPARGMPTVQEAVSYYHPEDRQRVSDSVNATIEGGEPYRIRCRLIRDDGVEREVWSTGQAARDAEGEVVSVFGVFQDLTEAYQMERRMQHTERLAAVGTLAASIAHEVNNPLSYVLLNTEAVQAELAARYGDAPSERELEVLGLVAEVRGGVERIERIVAGLKGFSRSREHQVLPVDLRGVLTTAARLVHNDLRHRARWTAELPEGPVMVDADEGQLVQVVVNLLLNAAQAASPRRPLAIQACTSLRGDQAILRVRDTGRGMQPEVLQSATSPFYTTRASADGTGLGLYVAQRIVEAHGGVLEITSDLAQGTTVEMRLPVHRVATPPQPAQRGRPPGLPGRVLIIDDQPLVGRALARALEPHEVEVIDDPLQARRRLVETPEAFDLVLCDLMMPRMSGVELYAEVPIEAQRRMAFLTGGAFTPEAEAFVGSMGPRVLPKPPRRAQLLELVDIALTEGRVDGLSPS